MAVRVAEKGGCRGSLRQAARRPASLGVAAMGGALRQLHLHAGPQAGRDAGLGSRPGARLYAGLDAGLGTGPQLGRSPERRPLCRPAGWACLWRRLGGTSVLSRQGETI